MKTVFVSYSRKQIDWVKNRLLPILSAAGLNTLTDEGFKAGKSVLGQVDLAQRLADHHILVLTRDYAASPYCKYEMRQAVALDPDCRQGLIIPIKREDIALPVDLAPRMPLYIEMDEVAECEAECWGKLLEACSARTRWSAPGWLEARDTTNHFLGRRQSVNLVVTGKETPWEALVEDLARPSGRFIKVDLNSPKTIEAHSLINEILERLGIAERATAPEEALATLQKAFEKSRRKPVLVLLHFERAKRYNGDFFGSLRYLIDHRLATILFQSRVPFKEIVPADDPLSKIDLQRVDLQ